MMRQGVVVRRVAVKAKVDACGHEAGAIHGATHVTEAPDATEFVHEHCHGRPRGCCLTLPSPDSHQ